MWPAVRLRHTQERRAAWTGVECASRRRRAPGTRWPGAGQGPSQAERCPASGEMITQEGGAEQRRGRRAGRAHEEVVSEEMWTGSDRHGKGVLGGGSCACRGPVGGEQPRGGALCVPGTAGRDLGEATDGQEPSHRTAVSRPDPVLAGRPGHRLRGGGRGREAGTRRYRGSA